MNRLTTLQWNGSPWRPFTDKGENLILSYEGQTSVDWPLRVKESKIIFLQDSSADWMDPGIPGVWQTLVVATMALATNHIFITRTKQWQNLLGMLSHLHDLETPAIPVPADIPYVRAIERANRNAGKFNKAGRELKIVADPARAKKPAVTAKKELTYTTVPWHPKNVFFGFTVNSVQEAQEMVFVLAEMRKIWPEINILVEQDVSEEAIDWDKLGMRRGVIDWLVWTGGPYEGWNLARDFGRKTGTRVYINEVTGDVPMESPDITGVLV